MHQYILNRKGLHIHIEEHLFEGDDVFLLCHGFTGSSYSHVIATIRSFLVSNKISSVSIDFTNNINQSEGEFADHTVSGEVEDLEVIYERVVQHYKKVYLVGHSMGCTVSLQFSLMKEVDGLLLIAPPYSMRDIIERIAKASYGDEKAALSKWQREGTYSFYKAKEGAFFSLSYEFYRDLSTIVPQRYRLLAVPTAIIYSLADPVVPPRDAEKLFDEIGSEKKVLISIPEAPHSFDTPESTQALLQKIDHSLQFFGKE